MKRRPDTSADLRLPGQVPAAALFPSRTVADQAFSRTAGAPLVEGNAVRILRDARENYPAWLNAIAAAERYVLFENYIVHDDEVGHLFADALIAAARRGVRVRLIYDWLGCFQKASPRFWSRLRQGGVEVRAFNPPRPDSPLGWLTRDHRKMLSVDGTIAFVTGLCVGKMWTGDPDRGLEPWRDTGVEIRGPAVAEIEEAFAQIWASMGEPIPDEELGCMLPLQIAGDVGVRIIATVPSTASMLRLDQLLAAVARERVWITDAYFAGISMHVQALRAAAKGGVDVRILLPNATDIPALKPISRAGYRPLLEAGVRIFEWNGTMLHAKTAVVDGRWARVGSTNLNVASWITNCELDVLVEDPHIGQEMEELYLQDLAYATEVVLGDKHRIRGGASYRGARPSIRGSGGGRRGTAIAGAVRVGHTLGAAFTDRRVLEPAEMRLTIAAGAILLLLAILFAVFPRLLLFPVILAIAWLGASLLYRSWRMWKHYGGAPKQRFRKLRRQGLRPRLERGPEAGEATESVEAEPAERMEPTERLDARAPSTEPTEPPEGR